MTPALLFGPGSQTPATNPSPQCPTMSERERWVVYPLLFLALGAALRDKLVDRTTTKSIVCQELAVVEEESTGREPARILAKIGRRPGGDGGYLLLNGNIEIIDEDPASFQPRTHVRIGRTDASPGAPATGYAMVSGQVVVDGVLNARQFAYHGIPFIPAAPIPGASIPDMIRALQQSGAANRASPGRAPAPNAKSQPNGKKDRPPANAPDGSANPDPRSPHSEESGKAAD